MTDITINIDVSNKRPKDSHLKCNILFTRPLHVWLETYLNGNGICISLHKT